MKSVKQLPTENYVGEDRLSALPDSVLVSIFLFLPFHFTVVTSVLSSRWRNLWTKQTTVGIKIDNIINRIKPAVGSDDISSFIKPRLPDYVYLNSFAIVHRLFGTLSESCPQLSNLSLDFYSIDDICLIHISCFSVKRLEVKLWDKYLLSNYISKPVKVVINASNLHYIKISNSYKGSFEFANIPTKLATASIDVYNSNQGEMLAIVYGVSCVRSLDLADDFGGFIDLLNFWEDRGRLPIFGELVELHLVYHFAGNSEQADRLPARMLAKVKKIKIEYAGGIKNDMTLLKWILRNSIVLEVLSVSVTCSCDRHYENDRKICKAIFMLERSSRKCNILFKGDYITASSSTVGSGEIVCETAI